MAFIRIISIIAFFFIQSTYIYAQNEISLNVIPNFPFRPRVSNPSPIGFFGDRVLSFSGSLSLTHFRENTKFGFRTAFTGGIVDYTYHSIVILDNVKFDFSDLPENFAYLGLAFSGVYRKQIRQDAQLEISAGVEKRVYRYNYETDTSGYSFKTSGIEKVSYKVLSNRIKDQFHLDFPATISVRQVLSSRSALTTGLAFNVGLSPIRKEILHILKDGKEYNGSYKSSSSYIGFDLRYNYNLIKHPNRISIKRIDSTSYKKAIFFELLGSGILYSINYDFRLKKNTNQGFGLRIGLGKGEYRSNETFGNRLTTFPLNLNYIYGKGRSGLEAGISLIPEFIFRDFENQANFYSNLNLGYRYQPLNKGLLLRLAYNPWIIWGNPGTSFGISVGYGFK